jgi:hypothetical protein
MNKQVYTQKKIVHGVDDRPSHNIEIGETRKFSPSYTMFRKEFIALVFGS